MGISYSTGFCSLIAIFPFALVMLTSLQYFSFTASYEIWRTSNLLCFELIQHSAKPNVLDLDLFATTYKYSYPYTHPKRTTSHSDAVTSTAFNKEGTRIVSGSSDGTMKVWAAETGKLLHTLSHSAQVVTFSPNASKIISGSNDNTVKVWDAKDSDDFESDD